MEKSINYLGYTAQPSDYTRPDGELAAVMDLWHEGGQLKPVLQPRVVLNNLTSTQQVLYVHKVSTDTHYIVYDSSSSTFYWIDSATPSVLRNMDSTGLSGSVIQVNSVGNTLLILTGSAIRYYLWKSDQSLGSYTYLGDHLPEMSLSFGLRSEVIEQSTEDVFQVNFAETITDVTADFSENNKNTITAAVLAHVNSFVANKATNEGKFIFPFFVRYAYRLFDGTVTMQSAPILMMTNTGTAPSVFWKDFVYYSSYLFAQFFVAAPVCQLDYVGNASQAAVLQNWKDIVKSVDIFISAPLYTYDQSGYCKRFRDSTAESTVYSYSALDWSASSYNLYKKQSVRSMYSEVSSLAPQGTLAYAKEVELPEKSLLGQDDCAQFYFLKSIGVQDIATSERTLIEPGTGYLTSLVNKEVLPDDYDSHDTIISSYSYAYNQRMNLTGITKKLFVGFDPLSNFVYIKDSLSSSTTRKAYVYIRQNGKEYVVESPSAQLGNIIYRGYFYYPNPNAYKVVIAETYQGTTTYYEEKLKTHPFLNGAYYFKTSSTDTTISIAPEPSSSRDVPLPNKLYTSEVGNPFLYPLLNINTVGLGKIIGIATASKALSQGQFGQFPLYVFTDEGIWAMSVSDTGTFSAKQTISRDVCLNAKSIAQIDSAVLFATERGLMIIQGSNVECFSDQVNNVDDAQFNYGTFTSIASALVPSSTDRSRFNVCDFREFITNCGMLYDYRSQRLIVFNPAKSYAYIFGMDGNKQWSMMRSSIQYSVNSYPEAYAVDSSARLLDFSKRVANGYDASGFSVLDQHLCTRPLKLDYADVLKTVDTIIQRGNFVRGHVRSAIFGSRDLINWFPIYTSTDHYLRGFSGTPYKYFRIALSCNLRDHESLTGCTVQFTPRETNNMK